MINELEPAAQWIYSRLAVPVIAAGLTKSTGTARIYDELNEDGGAYPFVVIILESAGNDFMIVRAQRVWTNPTFQVAAVGKTRSFLDLQPLATLIDTNLHGVSNAQAVGVRIVTCVRLRTHRQQSTDGTISYRKLGGIYQLQVAPLI